MNLYFKPGLQYSLSLPRSPIAAPSVCAAGAVEIVAVD